MDGTLLMMTKKNIGFKPGLKKLIHLSSDKCDSIHGFIPLDLVCMRPRDGLVARAAYHRWHLVQGSFGIKMTNIRIVAWRTLGQGSRVNLKLRERASRKSVTRH